MRMMRVVSQQEDDVTGVEREPTSKRFLFDASLRDIIVSSK